MKAGRAVGTGKWALWAAGWCVAIATGCGGVVRYGSLDDDGSSGQAGSGNVPPVGGAAGVGTAGFGGSTGGVQTGGASGLGGDGGGVGSAGTGSGGEAGAGGSEGFGSCTRMCGPLNFPGGRLAVCCAQPSGGEPSIERCGLDTGPLIGVDLDFREPCQAKHQPGVPDAACENLVIAAMGADSIQQGCCRTDAGICGFQVDRVGSGSSAIDLELGCVSGTVSLSPRPVTPCGQSPRPHYLECECTDGTTHGFCLPAGCGSGLEQGGVCAQACGGWDNRVRLGCSDNDQRCR